MAVKQIKISVLPAMSKPAIVTLIGYALLVFIVMLPIDMYMHDKETGAPVKQEYNFGHRLLLSLLMIFPFILSVYSVNCMMVGNCELWSWIVALFTLIWAIMITVTTFATKSFSLNQMMMA